MYTSYKNTKQQYLHLYRDILFAILHLFSLLNLDSSNNYTNDIKKYIKVSVGM